DDKGKITISTRQESDRVFVDITDTGKGISAENLERIFESGFTTKKVGAVGKSSILTPRSELDAYFERLDVYFMAQGVDVR
ncbi:MAG: ATPase, partial [Candidatus Latescibacteria bacterium]|nr:ATPase [Candidatus Latescibacterota bacterium]